MDVDGRKYDGEATENIGLKYESRSGSKVSTARARDEKLYVKIAMGFLYACFGYALGGCALPFGAMPFGIAFLCVSDRRVPYILAGLSLSALGTDKPAVLISAYLATLMIRILTRLTLDPPKSADGAGESAEERTVWGILPELFSENICLRMATSCVGCFIVGIYNLIEGGFLYYDLYGAILAMLAAPAAVLLCYGYFGRPREGSVFYYISHALFSFGISYSAREMYIYGVSLAAFGVMFAVLYACRKKGMVFGIAAAVVCGLAYSPMTAPAFIFAAVASGALWRVSALFASVSAFTVGMAWGFYVSGIGAITELMPAILAASLLFGVLDKLFFTVKASASEESVENEESESAICLVGDARLSEIRLDATEQKIKTLCETFSSMSRFFYDLADRMRRPLAADIKQICDSAFDACCGNCKNKNICWEENYTQTISSVASISAYVHKDGKIESDNVPKCMREVCERLPDIIDEINYNSMLHTKQLLLCDKTEIFALDYEAVSDLLAGSVSIDDEEYEPLSELCGRLCSALSGTGWDISSAVVFGKRKRRIVLNARSAAVFHKNERAIIKLVSDICEKEFEKSEIIEADGGEGAVMTLTEKRGICVEFAKKSVMSNGEEEFCGDTVSIFENSENDKFFSLISDGMGSGRDAALTSGICAMFMQKMLTSSNDCSSALKMLNGFLRNKGGGSMHECSATIDLLELDMIRGKASFYKSGAAPTYVFRDGSLFKLRSKTVPVGIIRELDAKKISFDVGEGDVIVMVSDGVTQGKDECPWLFDLLKKNIESEGIERTAELIVDRARNENGNDDISVVIIKVRRE